MVYYGFYEFFIEWRIGFKRVIYWFEIKDRFVKVRVRFKNGNYVKIIFGI